ncbi:hypothetical protein [Lutimonas zeaxanthinifaciens]|uniref:hypothetical protein n=1 Tax=Lutimonas zeaxanthinifaciens TaxID=3060215 RepID=UPI00265CC897|nr:hypothetical protein [Lutimonas sp. YSD2104]WKK65005.1 hypothetical protein QZH61_10470 [Lutimonas sp. YSD2104]
MSASQKYLKRSWPVWILLIFLSVWQVMKHFTKDVENSAGSSYGKIEASKESCVDCHINVQGFSKYHDPKLIGCVVCHLGNGKETDKTKAHKEMVLIPGNLSNAEQTCGTCHPDELFKISHSLMTTNSGIVAVDKYVFGETDSPDLHYDIRNLGHNAADEHLRNLCANCHLGAEKTELGKIDQLSRGGGCNACHLNYSDEAEQYLQAYLSSSKQELPSIHPSTDIFVKDEHCFGCHSRSSRISSNYMGWHETLLEEDEVLDTLRYKVFQDKRVYEFKGEDVHHSQGMLCIDCHSSHEVMGDGKRYLHEEEAVSLQCDDCHYQEKPATIDYEDLDKESLLVFMHREYSHQDRRMLRVQADGHPLVNTYVDENENVYLLGKKDGKKHLIKPQAESCSGNLSHAQLSCSTCHSQWAPRCIGCHNTYEKDQKGYDLLDKKIKSGTWVEHVFEFETGLPSLGVREVREGRKYEPAIPGMILTIEGDSDERIFERLYAANAPHTTGKEVRSCASCHQNPSALGYGKGKLNYTIEGSSGSWSFEPDYAENPYDGYPEDAWIGFLSEPSGKKVSTRTDFRPLNLKEQKSILRVGACLECHKESSEVMSRALKDGINPLLLDLSDNCILPDF